MNTDTASHTAAILEAPVREAPVREAPAGHPGAPWARLARLATIGDGLTDALEQRLAAIATLPDLEAVKLLLALSLAFDRATRATVRLSALMAKLAAPPKPPAARTPTATETRAAGKAAAATAAAAAKAEADAAAAAQTAIRDRRQFVMTMTSRAIADMTCHDQKPRLYADRDRALDALDDAAFDPTKLGMLTLRLCAELGLPTEWQGWRRQSETYALLAIKAALARGETWPGLADGIDPPDLEQRAAETRAAIERAAVERAAIERERAGERSSGEERVVA